MWLLLCSFALADSFMTSVALPVGGVQVPMAPGPCGPEIARLASVDDAFAHAMVLTACHGYDTNPPFIAQIKRATGPLAQLDLGYALIFAATYGGKESGAGEAALRSVIKARPSDPKTLLVAALGLAQLELFVKKGDWEVATPRTREIVRIVKTAAALNRSKPVDGFQAGLDAAIDYMVLYGVFAELVTERSTVPALGGG